MRVLFVADLHYSLKQFDWLLTRAGEFDLTIIGGDLLDLSSELDADVQIAIVERYLGALRRKNPLVVSSGNHDGDSRNVADESVAQWLLAAKADGLYVDGESFFLGPTRITVCPWWDGDLSRGQLEEVLVRESEQGPARWLWVHHAPPKGTRTSWTRGLPIGDQQLRVWIERFQPDWVLSGHIHNSPFYAEGSWIDRIGKTWVFNPGRQLGAQPTSIILDLKAMTAEWVSQEGRLVQDLLTQPVASDLGS